MRKRFTSQRCPRCFLPLRWCVCAASRAIASPLAIEVLMHHREMYRPSSTGHLITRVMAGARSHLWRRERRLDSAAVRVPGRELWTLHPGGEPMPAGVAPDQVQVLVLDGSWREASAMGQEVSAWGRQVRLPMEGESRYWLRAQQDGGRFSSVEALMCLLHAFGLEPARRELQVQFELHVYAGLRARGHKAAAAEFLKDSPIASAVPELLAQLEVRRPR